MYQPYPSGGQGLPQPTPPPRPVLTAVNLMYVGAGLSALTLILGLATIGSLKTAIRQAQPSFTAAQVHSAEVAGITVAVIIGLLGVGLWVWMAWANRAGKNWARIVASVLFAFNTLDLLSVITRPHAVIGLLFQVLLWLVGLGATVLLWQRESSAYFQASSARPR